MVILLSPLDTSGSPQTFVSASDWTPNQRDRSSLLYLQAPQSQCSLVRNDAPASSPVMGLNASWHQHYHASAPQLLMHGTVGYPWRLVQRNLVPPITFPACDPPQPSERLSRSSRCLCDWPFKLCSQNSSSHLRRRATLHVKDKGVYDACFTNRGTRSAFRHLTVMSLMH